MCAFRRRVRPPPEPRATPTTFQRPEATSVRSISRPASSSHPATKREISSSPAPPGTRSGLTESIRTSSAASSERLDKLHRSAADLDKADPHLAEHVEGLGDDRVGGDGLLPARFLLRQELDLEALDPRSVDGEHVEAEAVVDDLVALLGRTPQGAEDEAGQSVE